VSYHCSRISLILHHTFAKSLIALAFSTSLGSQKSYRVHIQLVAAIRLHPYKTLLLPLPDLWSLLFVKFAPYMNCAFSLDLNPAMSSWGTRTGASTNQWDMTAEHALSCLCDELKHSVDKSGCIDYVREIIPSWMAAKMMSPDQENPSKPMYIFGLPAHLNYNPQNLQHTILTSATASYHPWLYIQYFQPMFNITMIWNPPFSC